MEARTCGELLLGQSRLRSAQSSEALAHSSMESFGFLFHCRETLGRCTIDIDTIEVAFRPPALCGGVCCLRWSIRFRARKTVAVIRVLPLVVALLTLSACGGDDGGGGDPTGPDNASVAGTWDIVVTITGGTQGPVGTQFSATFTLAGSGTHVTGTFATVGGLSGQITGSVSGQVFTFSVAQGQPCPGTFNGSSTVSSSGATMSGSYSGSDSCAGALSSTFTGTKR